MNTKLGLIVIAVLALLKFLVVPWADWYSEKTQMLSQQQQTFSKLSQLDSKKEAMERAIAALAPQVESIQKRALTFDVAKATTTLLSFFELESAESGVQLAGLRIGEQQLGVRPFLPVRFAVSGKSKAVEAFLNSLEAAPYVLVTAEAMVGKVTRNQEELQINLTLYAIMSEPS